MVTMPRYFFDAVADNVRLDDDEGIDVASRIEAERLARQGLADLMRETLYGRPSEELAIEIRDASRRRIARLALRFRHEDMREEETVPR
jgi:hypothetical protein